MSTPITQILKPDAEQYRENRKLFLVPTFLLPHGAAEEGRQLLERYWSEVRDHVDNLERSLGKVSHVYHEVVFSDGEEGMKTLEQVNPQGCSFIKAMCHSDARLEATDDKALFEESADWQRCISIGLISEKVMSTAVEGYQEATRRRYEHIGARIDETLQGHESGALFIREEHGVQFPTDIQVFYVSPPSLDAFNRWLQDQYRAAEGAKQTQYREYRAAEGVQQAPESEEAEESQ